MTVLADWRGNGMKRAVLVILLAAVLALVVGCGGVVPDEYEEYADELEIYEDYEAEMEATEEETVWALSAEELSIPFERAAAYIVAMEAIFDEDDGALWGVHLGMPFMFADSVTRHAVANMPDVGGEIFVEHEGFYIGVLPLGTWIGNTTINFDGRDWGMMTWALVEDLDSETEILTIMVHELFHAWQQWHLGGGGRPHDQPHMNALFARVSVQLEIRALLAALNSDNEEQRLAAIHDALSVRGERRRRFADAAGVENTFEIGEGTATYTDLVLVRRDMGAILEWFEAFVGDWIIDSGASLSGNYGYITGAMYGFLLDKVGADWRRGVRFGAQDFRASTDLGARLKAAVGITELIPFSELDLELYGYSEIVAAERLWLEERERMVGEAIEAFDEAPVLMISNLGEFGGGGEMEVLEIMELGPAHGMVGTVFYGDFEYFGSFGRIRFTRGHMLWAPSWYHVPALDIEIDGNIVTGSNWVLELNEGYRVDEVRTGFRVAGS